MVVEKLIKNANKLLYHVHINKCYNSVDINKLLCTKLFKEINSNNCDCI